MLDESCQNFTKVLKMGAGLDRYSSLNMTSLYLKDFATSSRQINFSPEQEHVLIKFFVQTPFHMRVNDNKPQCCYEALLVDVDK